MRENYEGGAASNGQTGQENACYNECVLHIQQRTTACDGDTPEDFTTQGEMRYVWPWLGRDSNTKHDTVDYRHRCGGAAPTHI
jgi:hypothetical protein